MKINLLILCLCLLVFGGEYNRKEWKHWIDMDGDGQDTRQEVLIEENLATPEETEYRDGKIVKGLWQCLYTGEMFTDPTDLDIDHFVPLKEAYASGGDTWYPAQKKVYSNFTGTEHHLIAVKKGANRSKGAKDPAHWLPKTNVCWYVTTWVKVKIQWELSFDEEEKTAVLEILDECGCSEVGWDVQ